MYTAKDDGVTQDVINTAKERIERWRSKDNRENIEMSFDDDSQA